VPKSLILTFHYLDGNNGGSNASKGFLWSYASLNSETSLIYPEHDNFDSSAFIPDSVRKFPVYDHRSKIKKGIDIYRGKMHRFVNFVKEHLSREKYDIIFFDHSITSAGVINNAKKNGAKIVSIHHNVEADYIKDNQPSLLYRIPFNYFSKKAEQNALYMSDVNLTLTDETATIFRSWFPNKNLHLHTIGICEYKKNTSLFLRNEKKDHTFIISGSLDFEQSTKPIIDFVRKYFPIMKQICPDCKLIIAGRNPNNDIKNICSKHEKITLIANPPDMTEIVKQASIYIAPIFAGSGIKLRIMDGLKLGMPILCHKVSAAGYKAFEKAGYLYTYENESSFEKALNLITSKSFCANDIYSLYKNEFSFTTGTNKLKQILAEEGLL